MSSEIIKDITEALKHFKPSPAVYKISVGYRDNAQFRKETYPSTDKTDFMSDYLRKNFRVSESFDTYTRKHVLASGNKTDIYGNVRYDVISNLKRFVQDNGDSKNNKLTALYRWFNETVDTYAMSANTNLENDLYNIYKWISAAPGADKKSAIQVLEIIRQRYEPKGTK